MFFQPVLADYTVDSRPLQGYSLSYVNSGITVACIAASSTSESNSAQRAFHGITPVVKFTSPDSTLAGVDRQMRVKTRELL